MPNFQTNFLNDIKLPKNIDGFKFCYEAVSKRDNEKLIMVKNGDERFFIQQIKRKNDYLIKAEKLTKPNLVFNVQKALQLYSKIKEAKISFSNIFPKKIKKAKPQKWLKKIDYFVSNEIKQKCSIEVGFGSGRHLLFQAKQNPTTLFIGIEIHKPSIEQVLNLIEIENITNILIIDYDARDLLEVIGSNKINQIFVHFPVPWDKKPHRRVICNEFIEEAMRVLEIGGKLELRTDSEKYYEYSKNIMNSIDDSKFEILKNQDIEISSKYEDRWKKQQKNIYDLTLTNLKNSQEIENLYKLNFKECGEVLTSLDEIWKNFKNQTIKEGGFFIHLENIYTFYSGLLVKLSFGKNGKSEHKYIVIEKNGEGEKLKFNYFPNNTLSTKINKKIEKKIIKILNG